MSKKTEDLATEGTITPPTGEAFNLFLNEIEGGSVVYVPTVFDKTAHSKLGGGYDRRANGDAILGVVVHITKDKEGFTAEAGRLGRAQKESTHFLIGTPEGSVVPVAMIVPPYLMAYHAGPSMGYGFNDWDQISIGITVLLDVQKDALDPLQWQALTWLIKMLRRHYPSITFITRHSMIGQTEDKPIDDHWLGDPGAFEAWVKTTK